MSTRRSSTRETAPSPATRISWTTSCNSSLFCRETTRGHSRFPEPGRRDWHPASSSYPQHPLPLEQAEQDPGMLPKRFVPKWPVLHTFCQVLRGRICTISCTGHPFPGPKCPTFRTDLPPDTVQYDCQDEPRRVGGRSRSRLDMSDFSIGPAYLTRRSVRQKNQNLSQKCTTNYQTFDAIFAKYVRQKERTSWGACRVLAERPKRRQEASQTKRKVPLQ
ncbi:hypothetical protein BDZ89DRAFT_457000 [Hymenopellis radicata]|nr:hypothetical protein BDZ89DRAFT_457000 [Hymenopellis radicata]